jgi:acetyl-CoA carboxylase carboxyltransferase component
VFLQDVNGFMVGREAEQAGIIKAGAKLVNAVSNSRVPKITVLTAARSAPGTTPCAARRSTRGSSSPGPTPAAR